MRMGAMALTVATLVAGREARAADSCNVEVKEGPVWNGTDANTRCPAACHEKGFAAWAGPWWTTVPGQQSVCQCKDKLTTLEAGPIWNNEDANTKCPATCHEKGFASWTGMWWTTVWGQMSVCTCKNKRTAVEAGPVWGDSDAALKCPATCSASNGFWTGGWWTTVWGRMSVCECANLCR